MIKHFWIIMMTNATISRVKILVITFITALFAVADLHAQGWTYPTSQPATPFEGGTGTADNPYVIKTAQQLANMSYLVNSGDASYKSASYVVTADIDLAGNEWIPISRTTFAKNVSNAQNGTGFKGTFDGGGHTISGLTITDKTQVAGLFGYLSEGAVVKNMSINGNIESNEPAGAVAGLVYCSSKTAAAVVIDGILSSVNITEGGTSSSNDYSANAGGVLGFVYQATVQVLHCGFSGTMTRASDSTDARLNAIIGLVGTGENDTKVKAYINNCFNTTEDIPGSTNTPNSEQWGNFVYYRSSTNVIYMGANNYSACRKTQEFNMVKYLDKAQLTSGELIWELNQNDMAVSSSGAYVSGNTKYWAYDEETGLPRPVPVVFDEEKYHPVYGITIVSTSDKGVRKTFFTNSEGKVVNKELSVTAKYYLDEQCTQEIRLRDNIFTDDCVIYEVEQMVACLEADDTSLTVKFYLYGELQNSFPIVVDDNGTLKSYNFNYTWYKNGVAQSATSATCPLSDDGTYMVEVRSVPAGYQWTLRYTKGAHKVYCKPSSKSATEDGTMDNPYKNLTNAYRALLTTDQGGTIDNQMIVIMEDLKLSDDGFVRQCPEIPLKKSGCDDKPVTITANDGTRDFNVDGRHAALSFAAPTVGSSTPYMLTGDLKLENITLLGNMADGNYITCQGWNLTIDKNVDVVGFSDVAGGSGTGLFALSRNNGYITCPNLHIVAGYMDLNVNTIDGSLKYPHDSCNVTIRSGRFARVIGGSRVSSEINRNLYNHTLGDPVHPFKVNILIDIENPAEGKVDINQITGGQTDGNCYIDSHVTIRKGTIARLIGGNISFGRKGKDDSSPRNTFYGKVVMDIEGGTVHALYGQNLGRTDNDAIKAWAWFYGKTIINISGENTVVGISKEIDNGSNAVTGLYGGSSNGQAGYDENSTDVNKAVGKDFMEQMGWEKTTTTFNISGGTFMQPVYGAGYGYSEYITASRTDTDGGCLNGDVYMNISGGTFLDNVFGGARGTDTYMSIESLRAMAQVKGFVNMNITGGWFKKNIYGGSLGFSDPLLSEMAKVTGNINVSIKGTGTKVDGNVYGGGYNAKVEGDTNVTIGGETSGN